jgi:hypothetical protein
LATYESVPLQVSESIAVQSPPIVWTELRDERGKLCARLDARRLLLEVRRNHEFVVFDLHEYLQSCSGAPFVLD